MSDYGVVADVSETLLKLLRERLSDLVAADHITPASPAEIDLDTSPWLAVFLYRIVEHLQLNNEHMERIGENQARRPPFVVDLLYLVVPYAQSREDEQRILGRVIQVFSAQAILRGSWLQGKLAGTDDEFRVVFHPLPHEELLRLWSAFDNKPYKLSICYLVTPVKIDSAAPPISVQPVVERTVRVYEQ